MLARLTMKLILQRKRMCTRLPWFPAQGRSRPRPAAAPSTLERLWTPDAKPSPSGPPPVSEDQIRAREARARKEGRDEGMAQGLAEFEKKLAGEKQALVQAVREFARERETYFQRVEAEVVGLALAIARKILHREAQVDPLLLAGVVRVGLDNVAAGTRVRLRVHPDQIQAWQAFFSPTARLEVASGIDGRRHARAGPLPAGNRIGLDRLDSRNPTQGNRTGLFRPAGAETEKAVKRDE